MIYVVQTDDTDYASGNRAFGNLKDAIAYFDEINIYDLYESNSTAIIKAGFTEENCLPISLKASRTPKTKKEIIKFYNHYA
tara:strand:- start:125 stop:367 length:243 start_codon:yes stop_codon:yes gene_type:complete